MILRTATHRSEAGLSAAEFHKTAPNGFGDPMNAYSHSIGWFAGHVFAGTTRANLANRALQIAQNTPDRLGKVWPVPVPKDNFDNDLAAQIWRFNPQTGIWNHAYTAPKVIGIGGFPVPNCVGFRCMSVIQAKRDVKPTLYLPTWGSHQTPYSRLVRTEDGVNFDLLPELGPPLTDLRPRSIRGLVTFKNYLVAAPVVGQKRFEPNVAGSVVLLACQDPEEGRWENACQPGFGEPNNVSIFHLAVHRGELYAGTMNINEGFQVWKTAGETPPPFRWKKVLGEGAFRGRFNQVAMSLCAFDDHVYVGSAIQNCSFDYDYNVGPGAPEIVRIAPDGTWDIVVGEPRLTPQGLKIPLSGLGPAFGNPFAGYLWSMCEHDGWLYAGTGVWAVFLKYRPIPPDTPAQLKGLIPQPDDTAGMDFDTFLERFGGFDLWRTRDGSNWVPVTSNGFDNCYNIGVRTQVSTPYGLFAGTANPFGPLSAVRRAAGWRYEFNPRAGTEVWWGRPQESLPPPCDARTPLRIVTAFRPPEAGDDEAYDRSTETRLAEALLESFFRGTGLRNFGWWHTDTRQTPEACELLAGELAAFFPEGGRSIVDLRCGEAALVEFLLKHLPDAGVVGVAENRASAERLRDLLPRAQFLDRRALEALSSGAQHDLAIWLRELSPEQVARAVRIEQAWRVLRPGGTLAMFDWLETPLPRRFGFWRGERDWQTMAAYRQRLVERGFENVRMIDVTTQTQVPFQRRLAQFVALKVATLEIPEIEYPKVMAHLLGGHWQPTPTFLVVAQKPQGFLRN